MDENLYQGQKRNWKPLEIYELNSSKIVVEHAFFFKILVESNFLFFFCIFHFSFATVIWCTAIAFGALQELYAHVRDWLKNVLA